MLLHKLASQLKLLYALLPICQARWLWFRMVSNHRSRCIYLFADVFLEHPYVSHCQEYLAHARQDPLFSAPHLKSFLEYLSESSSRWHPGTYTSNARFTWLYTHSTAYDLQLSSNFNPKDYDPIKTATKGREDPKLLFLSGYPSAGWLNAIGYKYDVDMHFFQQHLSSIRPSVHLDVYAEPSLPSTSRHTLKLHVPTIGYLNDLGDSFGDLSRTRLLLSESLRKQDLRNAQYHPVGQSIIRDFYLHDQEQFTLLQDVSMCLLRDHDTWTGTASPPTAHVRR